MDTKIIHPNSSLMTLPEYDLFEVPPTQLTVEKDIQTEHRPISTITNALSPIQFEIHSSLDEYINLGKSELYLCLQISLSKTNMAKDPKVTEEDWKQICPVNYLMHSFFKQVKIEIGQTSVTSSASKDYAYVAYIDALMNISPQSKKTHLESAFWYRDIAGEMNNINEERSKKIRPTGSRMEDGSEFEMYGKLHLDLGAQIRPIIGGVTMTITLIPNDPKFYLMYNPLLVPHVSIRDIRYYIHRSKITPHVVIGHNKTLSKNNNALYFINRKEVKTFIIQKGTLDCQLNQVDNGRFPKKIFFGMVSNNSYNGDPTLNAFYFNSYGAYDITWFQGGQQFPMRPLNIDFTNNKFMRAYYGLYEAANQLNDTTTLDITREEYKDGFTLFGYNFTADLSGGINRDNTYCAPINSGITRIEIKFKYPLIETITVIVFCEYDNCIQIDSTRTASIDFT